MNCQESCKNGVLQQVKTAGKGSSVRPSWVDDSTVVELLKNVLQHPKTFQRKPNRQTIKVAILKFRYKFFFNRMANGMPWIISVTERPFSTVHFQSPQFTLARVEGNRFQRPCYGTSSLLTQSAQETQSTLFFRLPKDS